MKREAETGVRQLKVKKFLEPPEEEEVRKDSFLSSGLHNCEIINFCCFIYVVICFIALENEHSIQPIGLDT